MHKLNSAAARAAVASVALAGTIALACAAPASAQSDLLGQGSASPAVADLQRQLNRELSQTPELATDGRFGPLTADTVRWFQTCAGIKADGVVGPQTRAALAAHTDGRKVDDPCITVAAN